MSASENDTEHKTETAREAKRQRKHESMLPGTNIAPEGQQTTLLFTHTTSNAGLGVNISIGRYTSHV